MREDSSRRPMWYVAGPCGFTEGGRAYLAEIRAVLERLRISVLDPWEGPTTGTPLDVEEAVEIARKNFRMIRMADAVLAVCDGASVDDGTAVEMGYARALGLPVHGLRSDSRLGGETVQIGLNLQVFGAIKESGGELIGSIKELEGLVSRVIPGYRRSVA